MTPHRRTRAGRSLPTRVAGSICACTLVLCISMLGEIAAERDHLRLTDNGMETDRAPREHAIQDGGTSERPLSHLDVGGTAIDCNVGELAPTMSDAYYLTHACDGSFSRFGCPYLDRRSSTDSVHILIYGHHIACSPAVFGELAACYRQGEFDSLGCARLTAVEPGGAPRTVTFLPFCALRVPATYSAIQCFRFESHESKLAWLASVSGDATARCEGWQERLAGARQVLTLVTCTEGNGHSGHRTLVLFVSGERGGAA